MYKVHNFRVVPKLPKELAYLEKLAFNLYWSWDHNSRTLFRRIDETLWEETNRNPVLFLGVVKQDRLDELAHNDGFLSQLERVQESVDSYLSRKTWYQENHGDQNMNIGYFSMEYGLAGGLPIYSGGLGILAADHLKSASDLGLPLSAIGLAYQQGYFQQYLASDGWQQETYPINDFYNLPLVLERDDKHEPLLISVDLPGRKVYAQIWKIQVGRLPLYLLDTNISQNSDQDRRITAQLYGGDREMRIVQELLLGIGGLRALEVLGKRPDVCHMNEGHSAFLALERVRVMMAENDNLTFEQARQATRGGNVFTTHTPVPAGIDEFSTDLMEKYFSHFYSSLKLGKDNFFKLGGTHYPQTNGHFNMAIFAINMASKYNGVSRLHGEVARSMWSYLWPELPKKEIPIGHITNGVHIRTWISEDMSELYNRYLGQYWYRKPADSTIWKRIDQIPDEELWRTHERRRERLVAVARDRLKNQLINSGANKTEVARAAEVLNPEALTIGFSRRFAQYKRGYLLFKDLQRLEKIVNDKDRPVQVLIAGKAHPHDKIGKSIIRDIINIIREEDFRNNIVFLENYDMKIASYLVQGVDVWLNNPRRPHEASGTSGMKAAANGALNFSVLDGWWVEAYETDPLSGWPIGRGEEYDDHEYQDDIESKALYHTLETEIIPTFYNRGVGGLPREWITRMKVAMAKTSPFFNTNRMVQSYLNDLYLPAFDMNNKLTNNNLTPAKEWVKTVDTLERLWPAINIHSVESDNGKTVSIGEKVNVTATVNLGDLDPEKVSVQVYCGKLDENQKIVDGIAIPMVLEKTNPNGIHQYKTLIETNNTGRHGFTVRILPKHPFKESCVQTGLIKWYNS